MSHVRVWWTDTLRSHGCVSDTPDSQKPAYTQIYMWKGFTSAATRIQLPVVPNDCHFLYRNVRCVLRKNTSHMYQLKPHNSHDTQQAYSHI
jgi:tRNA G37 N-methylase Trm5